VWTCSKKKKIIFCICICICICFCFCICLWVFWGKFFWLVNLIWVLWCAIWGYICSCVNFEVKFIVRSGSGTSNFIRTQTINGQLKNEKIAFQINPCILLSAPRKRLSNNRTRKHTLASLCFYFQLVHIPITTSFFFTFKPKQSFHIICLHLEHRVDICYK
jgi:hypothetical protein